MSQACERDKTRLTNEEWERIFTKLRTTKGIYTGRSYQCRHFVEAVLWGLRVGGPWRSLPRDRGNWNSVFKRFAGGRRKECGGNSLNGGQSRRIYKRFLWIARRYVLMPVRPLLPRVAQTKRPWVGLGGLWKQDPRGRRWAGIAAQIYPDRRTSGGYYPGDPADGRPVAPSLFGRQRVRC